MFARLSAFVIWSFVAATAMFWGLRFAASPPQAPAYAVPVERSAPARGDLARLLGAAPVVAAAGQARPEVSSRFRLLGVMAPKSHAPDESSEYGLALIAVDGKPAKAFTVGARLEDGLVLQSVGLRTASLGPAQGARSVLLELPALPPPATGTLPVPGAPGTPNLAHAVPSRLPVPTSSPIVGTPLPAINTGVPAMNALVPTPNPTAITPTMSPPPPLPEGGEPSSNPALPSAEDARSR